MSNDQKNLYEELIQNMILDGITGMTPELKALVEKAPVEKQRSMILTILEENNVEHRLLCSKIHKTISDSSITEATHIKSVVQMLREYVKVSATEVKTMGEVMTPIELVEEMLDTLPVDVWSNPNLRWLDPCNGVGTFMSVVVERLMNGLKNFEPDDNKRYKHIIENMIYVCELQAKNMFLFLYAFDPKNEYALNVYNGSFLDEGFDNHMRTLGVDKFDVVVMNPPYNQAGNISGKSHSLWDKFVIKVLENILIESGYLVAVHPSGWRNINGRHQDLQNLLKSKRIIYLEMHSMSDGLKTFGAETRYDFYCLHNSNNNGNFITKIKCQDGVIERVDISKLKFIPNGKFDFIKKMFAINNEETTKILANQFYHNCKPYISKEKTDEFKYPVIYRVYKDSKLSFRYSSTNKGGHYGIPKLIWSDGRVKSVGSYIDDEGKYALNQFQFAIIDNPEKLPFIKKAFDSKKFRDLMEYCTVSTMSINHKVIALFRKDFWVDFLDYDETAVAEEKKKPVNKEKKKSTRKPKLVTTK